MSPATDQSIDSLVLKLKAAGVQVRSENNTARLDELEATLGKRFPQSFRSLLSRYSFPRFDIGGITFFDWDSERNTYLAEVLLPKNSLSELLVPAGFVQIGRPDTGIWDAVCFDLKDRDSQGESPIVLIDHEEILCNHRVKVVGELWRSFRAMADRIARGENTSE